MDFYLPSMRLFLRGEMRGKKGESILQRLVFSRAELGTGSFVLR